MCIQADGSRYLALDTILPFVLPPFSSLNFNSSLAVNSILVTLDESLKAVNILCLEPSFDLLIQPLQVHNEELPAENDLVNLSLLPELNLNELATLYPVSFMELVPSIKGIKSPLEILLKVLFHFRLLYITFLIH